MGGILLPKKIPIFYIFHAPKKTRTKRARTRRNHYLLNMWLLLSVQLYYIFVDNIIIIINLNKIKYILLINDFEMQTIKAE